MTSPLPVIRKKPAESKAVEPTKIRLGMVGLRYGGNIARELVRGNPFIDVVGLHDRDAARLERVSRELNRPRIDWKDLLRDQSIDAIGLFTGPIGRAGLIREIIHAGKDVLTTKPFETDIAAAQDVLREAELLGRIIHLNSPTPSPAADIRQIRDWQNEYRLGRPLAMRAETWAYYKERADGTWYDDPSVCGGAPLLRLGIYFLNDFASLLGEPETVHTTCSRLITERPTSDHAQVSIQYKSGALGHIFCSFCTQDGQPYKDYVTLNYERATIRRWVERTPDTSGTSHYAVLELQLPNSSHPIRVSTDLGQWCGWYQWQDFYTAVRERHLPGAITADETLFGLRLLHAINRSVESGKTEKVN